VQRVVLSGGVCLTDVISAVTEGMFNNVQLCICIFHLPDKFSSVTLLVI
jgi:hypothetical protein